MDAAGDHRRYRPRYPLQAPSKGSAQLSGGTSPSEGEDSSSLNGLLINTQVNNGSPPWYRAVTDTRVDPSSTTLQLESDSDPSSYQPMQDIQATGESTTAVSTSQRSTSPASAHRDYQSPSDDAQGASSAIQSLRNSQNEVSHVSSQWSRNPYPIQAITENSTEHHPSMPEEEHEHPPLEAPKPEQNGAVMRTLRRTPRSRRISPPTPPAEVEEAPHPVQLPENEQSITVSETNPWKRYKYPLQSTISGLTAFPAPASLLEIESENVNTTATHPPWESDQLAKGGKPWHRQAYPLQSSASNAALRCTSPTPPSSSPPSPPPSPERNPEHACKVAAKQLGENDQAATRSKTFHRQVYPLQSPASVANLRRSPSPSPSTEREPQVKDQGSTNQSRENELAIKVVNQWRRQVYPLQSPKNISPFQRPLTPQPPEEEAEKDYKAYSIHLPKNIRAVKDAEKHEYKGRSIVVCLDGTGDKFDNDNSNIVHLISALKKDDPHQVSYYQAGIGTYSAGGLSAGVTAALDMAVGAGLGLHVRDAYHFLMHTYKEGDKICIFGFSRGAYTARCLAGMIHKVGLLPPRNIQQIPFAYEFYANDTTEGWKQSEDFKNTFCIDVCVYFLGCFDSVTSVGFIPRQLPLSSTPTSKPRYFRHAMALDERRAKFKICRHESKDWEEMRKAASRTNAIAKTVQAAPVHSPPKYQAQNDAPPSYSRHMRYGSTNHPNVTDEEYESLTKHEAPFDTDVLEVWFAGAHADVGGGAVANDERHKLAHIPLRWMIRQSFECDTGIIFKTKVLAEYGLDVHTLWPKYERLNAPAHGPPPSFLEKYEKGLPPRSIRRSKLVPIDKHEKGEHFYHLKNHTDEDWTPEQVEDFYDAMSPLNDQLVQAPTWWILEVFPVRYKVPRAPGEVDIKLGMNLGRYRGVEDFEPNLHWTVLHRVQHMNYKIEARTAAYTTWRTVV